MGRIPSTAAGADDDAAGECNLEQQLMDRLEECRHRSDLCLIWVAFCASSTLTLADGVSLAKTRRRSSQVLDLLTAIGCIHDEEAAAAEAGLGSKQPVWQTPHARIPDKGLGTGGSQGKNEARFASAFSGGPASLGKGLGSLPGCNSSSGSRLPNPPSQKHTRKALSDPRNTNLAYFRHCFEFSFKPWDDGEFRSVGKIAKSMHGEVRHLESKDGIGVVAKVVANEAVNSSRRRESNERHAWFRDLENPIVEDLLTEISVLTCLQRSLEQCRNLIRLVGIFQDSSFTYLVTEYCDGGELFERVAYGDALAEVEKKRCVGQLLQAVRHLHGHNIGHRDISLENILLRRGDCVVMDFGQAVRLRAVDGTVLRYYAEAGKRMYRAPEMYVPREQIIKVVCPEDALPGTVTQVSYDRCRCEVILARDACPGKPCAAEPYGYAGAPADVFACGVCAFVLIVGKPPWTTARDLDPTFSFIRRHGVPVLLQQWRGGGRGPLTAPLADDACLLEQMLRVDPTGRPSVDECLRSPWFGPLDSQRSRRHTN